MRGTRAFPGIPVAFADGVANPWEGTPMDTRPIRHITWCALLAATVASGAFACKGGGSDAAPTAAPAPAPAPAAAADGDVVRYASMEMPASGIMSIRQAVPARKAADRVSAQVVTLQAGTAVTRVAQYNGFTLVSWNNGTGTGWIETALALRVVIFDGGLLPGQAEPAGFTDAGVVAPQPVAQPTPVAATPPVVAQPTPVPAPVPTPTVAKPAPTPPPPATAPGFKPPKLK
jgi:hypothetical protein